MSFSSSLDRIPFSVDILTQRVRNKGEQRCRYNLKHWKPKGSFDIFHYVRDNITLLQLRDTSGNFNHDVSISGYWIFYSSYKRALPLLKDLLDIICTPYKEELGVFAGFQGVLYAVRFENTQSKVAKFHSMGKLLLYITNINLYIWI